MKFGGDNQQAGGSVEVAVEGPPLSEELLERARAGDEDGEEKIAALEARVAELEGELAAAHEAFDAGERRQEIERRLRDAETIDIETARLLTEAAVGAMDEPDVALAIEDLKRRKPYLFGAGGTYGTRARAATALSPAGETGGDGGRELLQELAADARASGDRRALLQYLRRRRGVC